MYGIDLKRHHSLASCVYIQELFNPILEPIGISYSNYIKIHSKDCSRELLTNNPEWIDHFYQNSLFNSVGAVDVEHHHRTQAVSVCHSKLVKDKTFGALRASLTSFPLILISP